MGTPCKCFARRGSTDTHFVVLLLLCVSVIAWSSFAGKPSRPEPAKHIPRYAELERANPAHARLIGDLLAVQDVRTEFVPVVPAARPSVPRDIFDRIADAQPDSATAPRWQDAPIVVPVPARPVVTTGTAICRDDGSYAGWIGPSGSAPPVADEPTAVSLQRRAWQPAVDYAAIADSYDPGPRVYTPGERFGSYTYSASLRREPFARTRTASSFGPGVAENGSYYGELSTCTGMPKTVHVNSYARRDGTYVQGHYRSR